MSDMKLVVTVPLADIERMAVAMAKSGLFGFRTTEQALSIMLIAQAEGRHPALAALDYDVIQGRISKKAQAMMRDFTQSGGKVQWHELSDTAVDATFSHPKGGEVRVHWDMKRAMQAGVAGKDNWKKYPRQMLRARVVSEGVRTVFPMATSGLYVPEEVSDFDRTSDVPPPKQVVEAKIVNAPQVADNDWIIPFGKSLKGKRFGEVSLNEAQTVCNWLMSKASEGRKMSEDELRFCTLIDRELEQNAAEAAFEDDDKIPF